MRHLLETGKSFSVNNTEINKHHTRAMGWLTVGQIIKQIWDFIVAVILAKLLLPNEFGIFAIASIFISIISLFTFLGFPIVFVQRKCVIIKQYRIAQSILFVLGCSAFLVILLAAPYIGRLYNMPLLIPLLSFLGTEFLFSFPVPIALAILSRAMRFKIIATIEIACSLVYGILSLILAFTGFGVWTFGIAHYIAAIFNLVAFCVAAHYFPRFSWNRKYAISIAYFGASLTFSNLLNLISRNLDYLLIGKYLGASALGLYKRAYDLATLPKDKVNDIVARSTLPILTAVREQRAEYISILKKLSKLISLICFPALAGLFITSNEFIVVFYGNNWIAASSSLKALSLGGIPYTLATAYSIIFITHRKTKLVLLFQVLYVVFIAIGVITGIPHGITWVAIGVTFAMSLVCLLLINKSISLVKCSFSEILKSIKPAILATIGMCCTILLIKSMCFATTEIIGLLIDVTFGIASYYVFLLIQNDSDFLSFHKHITSKIRLIYIHCTSALYNFVPSHKG
jgi:O-antigen/teichoic acid export membrane protein